jgi:cytochrome c-type biogenesis protein CcmE
MKPKYIIGILVVVAAIVLASLSFGENLKQYVTIREAIDSRAEVQVKGALQMDQIRYDMDEQVLYFAIRDEDGTELPVVFNGSKPGNLEQARQIVAIGHFNGQHFEASKLLVKCPSKYTEEGDMVAESS